MKILKLSAENVKRLVAVEITPAGDVVVIGGKNGAGKSSVLDAIAMTIGGKDMVCDKPVRDGFEKGWSTVQLDNGLTVRRNYTEKGTTSVTITDGNGAKYASPQGILDKLTGNLTFDPMAFNKLKPLDQKQVLEKIAGLDFTKLDALHAGLYAQRTDLNRAVTTQKSLLANCAHYADAPNELVDIMELNSELDKAYQTQSAIERRRNFLAKQLEDGKLLSQRVLEAKNKVVELKEELRKQEADVLRLEAVLFDCRTNYSREHTEVSSLVDPPVQEIKDKIQGATTLNLKVQANQDHRKHAELLKAAEGEVESINSQIDDLVFEKLQTLAAAKFPVDGLGLSSDGITYKGIPWAQVNTGEQVRVSVAMGMAMNPELRVLLIRDGSLMDEDTMASICAMAKDKDYQLWIETCHPDGMQAVIIEAGEVRQ